MPKPPEGPTQLWAPQPTSVKFATTGMVYGVLLLPFVQPEPVQPSFSMPSRSVASEPAPVRGVSCTELKPIRYCKRPWKPSDMSNMSSPVSYATRWSPSRPPPKNSYASSRPASDSRYEMRVCDPTAAKVNELSSCPDWGA